MSADKKQGANNPLIVLDRDGVINQESDAFIKSPEEWIALPDSLLAISLLTQAGFEIAVATNQSGVGRGLFSLESLDAIHALMCEQIAGAGGELAGVFYCPHHPDMHCACRKPLPGLLQEIAIAFERTARDMVVVGDSLRDLQAAWAIGAQAILVRTGNGVTTESNLPSDKSTPVFDNLLAVARALIERSKT